MPEPARALAARAGRAPAVLRSRLTRAITRIPAGLVRRLHASGLVMALLAPLRWWLNRGAVIVAAGPAKGLRFSKRDLPVVHAQAYYLPRGTLEPGVQEALRRTVAPGAVVWDVGANIGFFSMLAARLAGPQGRVCSFEPVPACAAAVQRNADLNGFSEQVSVHELAISAIDGTAQLLVVGEASWSHLAERGRHPGTSAEISVRTATADELVRSGEAPPPDVIKLDVEGSELDVLRGMGEVLAAHSPVVICELHATNREFVELMARAGYVVENLDGPGRVEEAGAVHVLARRGAG